MQKTKTAKPKKLGRPVRKNSSPEMKAVLLDRYLKLCRKHGSHAVTLQMLSKDADVSFSTVHYYFGGPDRDIVAEAILFVLRHGQAHIAQSMAKQKVESLQELLEAYFHANLAWVEEFPHFASFWIFQYYLSGTSVAFQKYAREASAVARARLGEWVDEFVEQGQIKSEGREQIIFQSWTWLLGLFVIVSGGGSDAPRKQSNWIRTGIENIVGPYLA